MFKIFFCFHGPGTSQTIIVSCFSQRTLLRTYRVCGFFFQFFRGHSHIPKCKRVNPRAKISEQFERVAPSPEEVNKHFIQYFDEKVVYTSLTLPHFSHPYILAYVPDKLVS